MKENQAHNSPLSPFRPAGRAIAVAIEANDESPDSPAKIVASGRGKIAEQILALAFEKGVKVREDADLAELLAKLELDTPIPSEAVVAVAEILAKVYQTNASLMAAETANCGT